MTDLSGPANGLTADAALAISALGQDSLPRGALENAKLAFLDTVGVTVAGAATTTAVRLQSVIEQLSGADQCTVIGSALRTDPLNAAVANGTAGHALDYDDVSWNMIAHPSVAVLPAVLAVGEARHLSGAEVLAAYVAGIEFGAALGRVINPGHYEAGWHATGTLGTLAAAAAASRALGLDARRVETALGIAVSLAAGVRQNFGTDTKPLHPGNAARSGVFAALLAEAGFTAASDIIGAQWGFFQAFSNPEKPPRPDAFSLFHDRWELLEPGLLFKAYPSCVSTHTSIDATLQLRRDYGLKASDIRSADVGVVYLSTKMLIHPRPTTGLEGKFSMQYCVARALTSGEVRLAHFTDSQVNEPDVQELLRRITMTIDPAVTDDWRVGQPRPAIVRLTLTSGDTVSARVDIPTGNGGKVTSTEVEAKFADCTHDQLGPQRSAEVANAIADLPKLDDITKLMRLLEVRHA